MAASVVTEEAGPGAHTEPEPSHTTTAPPPEVHREPTAVVRPTGEAHIPGGRTASTEV